MLLICSAWDEEIKGLASHKAKQLEENLRLDALGIGYLEAALSLQRILTDNTSITEIIFIGTAGAYTQDLQIGEITKVKNVGLLNIGSVLDMSYVPKTYEIFQSQKSKGVGSELKQAFCLSSLEITKDENLSKKIIKLYSCQELVLVENMELYGVAKIATEYQIPWSALLGITNYTDKNAHHNWRAYHHQVSESLCNTVVGNFETNLYK